MSDQSNICVQHVLGSPCKIKKDGVEIIGRYIGDSNISCTKSNIILICTPCNSIIHEEESAVCFDLTRSDLTDLKDFEEDAVTKQEWYHTFRDETSLRGIGTFISPSDISPIILNDE